MKNKLSAKIFWMGGAPCAGKSSIAKLLSEKHGMQHYYCDDHFQNHVDRSNASHQKHLAALKKFSWDALFMRPVDEQLQDELAIYREEFSFILEDLDNFAQGSAILVEGNALLPELVAPLLPSPDHAIWLVPSADFQIKTYPQRGAWVNQIKSFFAEPEIAFNNWMQRDILFAQEILAQAEEYHLNHLVIDGSRSIAQVAEKVEKLILPMMNR